MAKLTCSSCSKGIPPEDVNVPEGVAFCRQCGNLFRLRDILDDAHHPPVDASLPPNGCIIVDDGVHTTVRASARSFKSALMALGVAAFWNGILSLFIAQALAVSYRHAFGHNANWLPVPNWPQFPNALPPVWFAVFIWLFLVPFIVMGCLMIAWLMIAAAGRVEVRLRGTDGVAFVGCGPIGWTRRFNANEIKSVHLGKSKWLKQEDGQEHTVIVIEGERVIHIGSGLAVDRRRWMAAALRKLLVH